MEIYGFLDVYMVFGSLLSLSGKANAGARIGKGGIRGVPAKGACG